VRAARTKESAPLAACVRSVWSVTTGQATFSSRVIVDDTKLKQMQHLPAEILRAMN